MTPSLSREKKEFFDLVKNYSYFTPNGWFDLEAFCVSVSLSLVCDDQPDLAPQPIDIYRAFLRVAKSRLDKENFAQYVKNSTNSNVRHLDVHDYLDQSITSVHVAGLLECLHDWVVQIGGLRSEQTVTEQSDLYFGWIDPNWVYTYSLVSGLHNAIVTYTHSVNRQAMASMPPSLSKLATTSNTQTGAHAIDNVLRRTQAQQTLNAKIKTALDAGFPLEAITLEECSLKSCLLHYLTKQGVDARNFTVSKMLMHARSKQHLKLQLLEDIDAWHEQKNTLLDNFVEDNIHDASNPQHHVDLDSHNIAVAGFDLCRSVYDWYCDHVLATVSPEEMGKSKVN